MAGINLVELLIVMLIIAILAGIGVPSFKYITASNRIAGEVNALLGDMRYARTEAIKEGSWVTVCAATFTNLGSTSTTPTAVCSGSNSWATGWIVFSDPSNDQTAPAAYAGLLHVEAPFVGGVYADTLTAADKSSTGVVAVTFNREGFATSYNTLGTTTPTSGTAATPPTLMKLNATPSNVDWTRCLSISATGTVTTEVVSAAAGSAASAAGFTACSP
jgi:type IV fimbrial biogenesis protein FimT